MTLSTEYKTAIRLMQEAGTLVNYFQDRIEEAEAAKAKGRDHMDIDMLARNLAEKQAEWEKRTATVKTMRDAKK